MGKKVKNEIQPNLQKGQAANRSAHYLLGQSMLVELQYDLTRKQRLIPHLRIWGVIQLFVILGIFAVAAATVQHSWWTSFVVALLILWFGRGYIIGLFNVVFVRSQHMDIRIEDNGLGYMTGKERWYILLDGLTAVRDLERSVWTIQHWNGTIVNIPKKILSDEALKFLRGWVCQANDIRNKYGIQSPDPTKPTKA